MATTYTKAGPGDDATKVLAQALVRYHQVLVNEKVTVEVLLASNPEGQPVMHHGWPACAVVKVNSLKDRAAGCCDARIVVDGDGFENWTAGKRLAVLDHLLEHLELLYDKEGAVKTDDLGRPRLRLKPHDWQMGGFDAICERHGANAVEGQALAKALKRLQQQQFDWDAAEVLAGAGSEAGELAGV